MRRFFRIYIVAILLHSYTKGWKNRTIFSFFHAVSIIVIVKVICNNTEYGISSYKKNTYILLSVVVGASVATLNKNCEL